MKFFKKEFLEFYFEDKKYQDKYTSSRIINTILCEGSPSTSCWWSNLDRNVLGFNNIKDYIKDWQHKRIYNKENSVVESSISTVKTCPAVLNILTNSFLIKSPCDIVITITKDGEFIYNTPGSDLLKIESHHVGQFHTKENNLFEGKMNLKFVIPVFIKTPFIPFIFLQPMYHRNTWYTVINGSISGDYTKAQPLNINVLVDIPKTKEAVSYSIEKGDVLAYLWLPKKLKLKISDYNFLPTMGRTSWKSRENFK